MGGRHQHRERSNPRPRCRRSSQLLTIHTRNSIQTNLSIILPWLGMLCREDPSPCSTPYFKSQVATSLDGYIAQDDIEPDIRHCAWTHLAPGYHALLR